MSESNKNIDKDTYRDSDSYRAQHSAKGEKEYRLRPIEIIQLRLTIGLRCPVMEKWRVDLMADKDQLRQLINPRGTMRGRILIPLRTSEKDQLTFLIGLLCPMKGNIFQNVFKSSWEYCPSFGWLT